MAGELPEYLAWVRKQPCAQCGTRLQIEGHHATHGDTVAPGEQRPAKSVGARRGKGQRAHDHFLIPLCLKCHAALHRLSGPFKWWTKRELRGWQDSQVATHRAHYEAGDKSTCPF